MLLLCKAQPSPCGGTVYTQVGGYTQYETACRIIII
jgi:hypothetical protein